MAIDIDCDMGEAYSIYKRGDDEAIVPCITSTNVVWDILAALDCDDEGRGIIAREHKPVEPDQAVTQIMRVLTEGVTCFVNGKDVPTKAETHLRPFRYAERRRRRQGRAQGGRPLYRLIVRIRPHRQRDIAKGLTSVAQRATTSAGCRGFGDIRVGETGCS